jgi:hypothetical protein
MFKHLWIFLLLPSLTFALILGAGCAGPHYYFAPEEPTPLTPYGMLGAPFQVPGDAKSTVRILPLGVREFKGKKVLKIRLYCENTGKQPWDINIHQQTLRLGMKPDEPISSLNPPDYPPNDVIELPKEVSRVVELLFPVPADISKDSELDRFVLTWKIVVGAHPFGGTVVFHRTIAPSSPDDTNSTLPKRGGVTHRG